MSYHFIEDKEFRKKMRAECSDIVNKLTLKINKEGSLEVKFYLVGSGARHLETQNSNEPVDLDYNLEILKQNIRDNEVKNYVMNAFNEVLEENDWNDCYVHDSKSAITTGLRYFTKGNKTSFSIDLAIVKRNQYGYHRLIHNKTGFTFMDQWYWNEVRNSNGLDKKVDAIKDQNLWPKLRERYLEKKNYYLSRNDNSHPSFICYIEAVNEIYNLCK